MQRDAVIGRPTQLDVRYRWVSRCGLGETGAERTPHDRMPGSRAGVMANWDAVFHAAARQGVAIEIDGDPSRQDLDHILARHALGCGCLFALDSDAHTTGQLSDAETAIAHARGAEIPADRIVCWPLERLLAWVRHPSSECLS